MKREWKWSNGQPYEKSNLTPNREEISISTQVSDEIKETSANAICQSLNGQAYSYGETLFSRNEHGNRREETYSKMAERKMTNQVNQNPFLLNCDYVNDLMTQDKYMKPVNTTFEKVKKP
jgi:hypothetical protein